MGFIPSAQVGYPLYLSYKLYAMHVEGSHHHLRSLQRYGFIYSDFEVKVPQTRDLREDTLAHARTPARACRSFTTVCFRCFGVRRSC